MDLTKETDLIFCQIYAEYLRRRDSGVPKAEAVQFGTPEQLVDDFLQGTLPDDVYEAIKELGRIGYVSRYVVGNFKLEDSAIIFMEGRFKKKLIEVTSFIAKFIP